MGHSFQCIMACPATDETLMGLPVKFNSPYQLYTCFLTDEEGEWFDCYILKKGKEIHFLAKWSQLRQLGEEKGLDPKFWKKGPGSFRDKVLRIQFALNQL